MPKSKLRGGKKAHRKRVQKRNQKISSDQNRVRNFFQKELMKELEAEKERIESAGSEVVEVDDKDTEKKGS